MLGKVLQDNNKADSTGKTSIRYKHVMPKGCSTSMVTSKRIEKRGNKNTAIMGVEKHCLVSYKI